MKTDIKPVFDKVTANGEPTQEFLDLIINYKPDDFLVLDLVIMICENWDHQCFKIKDSRSDFQSVHLSVLGSHSNRMLIRAMKKNVHLWYDFGCMHLDTWKVGGHYHFIINHDPSRSYHFRRKRKHVTTYT
jgi:hypothetical protein